MGRLAEGWQSGRMRRSRKPLSVVRRIEGSNPSPSAFTLGSRVVERESGAKRPVESSGPVRSSPVRGAADCRTTVARAEAGQPVRRIARPASALLAGCAGEIGVDEGDGLVLVAGHEVPVAVERDLN